MTARTFEDSAGVVWEVFEVHRTSQKAGAVSAGMERGWLAFANGETKRRLAPFPPEWVTAPPAELERLCAAARVAPAPQYPLGQPLRPRIQRDRTIDAIRTTSGSEGTTADMSDTVEERHTQEGDAADPTADVETTVRDFAHMARARGMPAVEAMIELKTLLLRKHPDPRSDARDRRRVRRWFVEAYYFERNT